METKPNRIREWRELRRMSQAQLGESMTPRCRKAKISKMESGAQPMKEADMRALADALNCKPADLLGASQGLRDKTTPYLPYPANVGLDADDVAEDVNTSLDALRDLYRRSTQEVRRDFCAIIRHDVEQDDHGDRPKKTG